MINDKFLNKQINMIIDSWKNLCNVNFNHCCHSKNKQLNQLIYPIKLLNIAKKLNFPVYCKNANKISDQLFSFNFFFQHKLLYGKFPLLEVRNCISRRPVNVAGSYGNRGRFLHSWRFLNYFSGKCL